MEIPIVTKEVRYALDYLFSKIAGHSDYHGDDILSAIVRIKEGKDIKPVPCSDQPKGRMTNADIIRAMTDEELSKYIDTYLGVSPWCVYPADPQTNKCIAPYEQCCGCILEWLKQQHANVE